MLLAAMSAAPAASLPARNLGFEAWDAQGRPEAWRLGADPHYLFSADCTAGRLGGCSL